MINREDMLELTRRMTLSRHCFSCRRRNPSGHAGDGIAVSSQGDGFPDGILVIPV